MSYLILVWCLLAAVVVTIAGYRKMIAHREDDLVHLGDADTRLVDAQKIVADRLSGIDKWGKILTVLTVVSGLLLGSVYLYHGWVDGTQLQF